MHMLAVHRVFIDPRQFAEHGLNFLVSVHQTIELMHPRIAPMVIGLTQQRLELLARGFDLMRAPVQFTIDCPQRIPLRHELFVFGVQTENAVLAVSG
ncbi:hypothetical protein CI15_33485 [Paraburkholderia monticola]|uniref:Uncharacterized protein n=1 Tax=Paraburkholderia monticola TaxID=1399968 RepID=A0A149PBP7_9BURK|nr:hypothetical protein CI15_33485 [Paraburkholderia monticola]